MVQTLVNAKNNASAEAIVMLLLCCAYLMRESNQLSIYDIDAMKIVIKDKNKNKKNDL